MQVRNSGNYEAWVRFFLEGVVTVSDQVVSTTRRLQQLERDDTDRMIAVNAGQEGIQLLRYLMQQPVVQVKDVEQALSISYSKANMLMAAFEKAGILNQISQGRRNRKFAYKDYIAILAEGTELNSTEEVRKEESGHE